MTYDHFFSITRPFKKGMKWFDDSLKLLIMKMFLFYICTFLSCNLLAPTTLEYVFVSA